VKARAAQQRQLSCSLQQGKYQQGSNRKAPRAVTQGEGLGRGSAIRPPLSPLPEEAVLGVPDAGLVLRSGAGGVVGPRPPGADVRAVGGGEVDGCR